MGMPDTLAEVSDQIELMERMMITISHVDIDMAEERSQEIINACKAMIQSVLSIRLLDMLNEIWISKEETSILDEFEAWALETINYFSN